MTTFWRNWLLFGVILYADWQTVQYLHVFLGLASSGERVAMRLKGGLDEGRLGQVWTSCRKTGLETSVHL